MAILIPAEAALRRLIVIAAADLKEKLKPGTIERWLKADSRMLEGVFAPKAQEAGICEDEARCRNDHEGLNPDTTPELKAPASKRDSSSTSSSPAFVFNRFDPRLSFADVFPYGLEGARPPFPEILPENKSVRPVNAVNLWRRINALDYAATHLDAAALRYLRFKLRREEVRRQALARKKPVPNRWRSPFKPGGPPGYQPKLWSGDAKNYRHQVHDLLKDCATFANEIEHGPPPWLAKHRQLEKSEAERAIRYAEREKARQA